MITLPLVNLWKLRSLVFHFALMNIKIRFKATYLGFAWTAIEPTLTFILLYVVFTSIRIRPGENFAIYLLTGVIIYHVFVRGTMGGLTSLRSNRSIIESLNIPREFFPVVATVATGLLLFVSVGVFFGLMPFFEFIPSWTVILLPVVLVLLILLVLGVSYFLSILNVYIKDVQPFWAIGVHALFFISPIIWYVDNASGILLQIHRINPIGQLIELGHKIVVFGQLPPITDWYYSAIFSVSFFIIGYFIFHKFEDRIAEVL